VVIHESRQETSLSLFYSLSSPAVPFYLFERQTFSFMRTVYGHLAWIRIFACALFVALAVLCRAHVAIADACGRPHPIREMARIEQSDSNHNRAFKWGRSRCIDRLSRQFSSRIANVATLAHYA